MKYEMIFGDETLFDGATDDVDMIGYNGGFYKNSQNGPMYCCGCTFTTDEYRNKGFIAMRRIIKDKVDDENELENLYWEFDSQRSKKTTDERLLFKGKLRYYASIASVDKSTKEPKRWTWEDKKAGRLPEVGAKCNHCHSVDERTVLSVTDKYVGIECDNSDINPYFVTHAEFIQYYIPIETPAEKAKREEGEFVVAMLDAASHEQLMSAGFKSGVIAAYRKLKGGE